MQTMLGMQPFKDFAHLFRVYAIPVVSRFSGIPQINVANATTTNITNAMNNVVIGQYGNTYLGTRFINIGSTITMSNAGQARVRQLARINGRHPHMIQVIANENRFGGVGLWHEFGSSYVPLYHSHTGPSTSPRIALTATYRGSEILWSPRWHGTFIHEFGHTFGELIDNHDTNIENRGGCLIPARANVGYITVAGGTTWNNISWSHWFGYRNVLNSPRRISASSADGGSIRWYVPSAFGSIGAQGTCIMVGSWASNVFNGITRAELTRRMAHISGETFRGRPSTTGSALLDVPHNRYVTVRENYKNRILDSAFHGNYRLHTVTIPASIRYIGNFAFIGATNLRFINNHSQVPQDIRGYVDTIFAGIPNRNRIAVYVPPGTLLAYAQAGWGVFDLREGGFRVNGTMVTQFRAPSNFNGVVQIQEGITAISDMVFLNNRVVTKLILPSTLSAIGTSTFRGVTALRYIYSYSLVPPQIGAQTFLNVNRANIRLTIPWAYFGYYFNNGWTGFNTVMGQVFEFEEVRDVVNGQLLDEVIVRAGERAWRGAGWGFGWFGLENLVPMYSIPISITVPETVMIEGTIRRVTRIAENGFILDSFSYIRFLCVPRSITRIGNNAFDRRTNVERI